MVLIHSQSRTRRAIGAVIFLSGMAISYVAVSAITPQGREARMAVVDSTAPGKPPVNPFASSNGSNLVALVITASNCGWSSQPRTVEGLGAIRSSLQSAHAGSYARISVIGVALDDTVANGLKFLSQIRRGNVGSAFDQVVVGGSWLNEEIVRYVWMAKAAEASTPQVVLLERRIDTRDYLSASRIAVASDTHVQNVVGSAAILRWLADGVPLARQPRATGEPVNGPSL